MNWKLFENVHVLSSKLFSIALRIWLKAITKKELMIEVRRDKTPMIGLHGGILSQDAHIITNA